MSSELHANDRAPVPKRVWLALAGSLVLWASAFVGVRATLKDFSPNSLALLRFLVASTALLSGRFAVKWVRGNSVKVPAIGDVPLVLLCALLVVVIYNLGLNFGERTVSAGTASFIVGQLPVCSILIAAIFMKERVNAVAWLGVGIGAIGTMLMLFADQTGLKLNIGSLYVIGAVIAESVYFALSKALLRRYSALDLNLSVTVCGTVMMLPFLPLLIRDLATASSVGLWIVVYMGIFPAAIAYLLWSYAMANLSVASATSSLYALPLLTIAVSFAYLGELPSLLGIVGGIVSLLGAVLVNQRKRKANLADT